MPPRRIPARPAPALPAAKWDEVKNLRRAYDRAVRQETAKQADLEQAIKNRAYRAAIPRDKLEDAQAATREVRRHEMEYERYLKTHVMPAHFELDFNVEVYGASRRPRSQATELRVGSVNDIWTMQTFYDSSCFDETGDMINKLLVSQGGSYPGNGGTCGARISAMIANSSIAAPYIRIRVRRQGPAGRIRGRACAAPWCRARH